MRNDPLHDHRMRNDFRCLDLEGGRTWKKWTKHILTEKIVFKKVILPKILEFFQAAGMAPFSIPRYGPLSLRRACA